jgi:hypothetical protein
MSNLSIRPRKEVGRVDKGPAIPSKKMLVATNIFLAHPNL